MTKFERKKKKKGKRNQKCLDGDHSWSYWTPKDEELVDN